MKRVLAAMLLSCLPFTSIAAGESAQLDPAAARCLADLAAVGLKPSLLIASAAAAADGHSTSGTLFAVIDVISKPSLQRIRIKCHFGFRQVAFLPRLHRAASNQGDAQY